MRKNKRGRSRRGGYWFYPGPGDDEHAFTKLRNNFSSGSWKFWQKKPEEVPLMSVSSDEQPAEEEPVQGSLEYPSTETMPEAPMEPTQMDNQEAPMEPSQINIPNEQVPMEESPEPNPETLEAEKPITGGRRRRRSRTTKKRKRSNMRRRTNKRRRSNKRRR